MFESYRERQCRNYPEVICPSDACQFECQEGAVISALVAQRIEQGFSKSEAASSILAERTKKSAPPLVAPQNTAERLPSSDAAEGGADTTSELPNGDRA